MGLSRSASPRLGVHAVALACAALSLQCGTRSSAPAKASPSAPGGLDEQCSAGNARACSELGKQLRADAPERAEALFQRACDSGDAPGCGALGELRIAQEDYAAARAL